MLVAPVWKEGALKAKLYLPKLLPQFSDSNAELNSFHEEEDELLKSKVVDGIFSTECRKGDNRSGWFNFLIGEYFRGGREVTVDAPIDTALPPVFIPEGGMLLLRRFMHYTTEVPDDERTVLLFPSPLSASSRSRMEISLIDDDGVSTNHIEKQEYFVARVWMETSYPSAGVAVGIEIVHTEFRQAYSVVWVTVATEEPAHRFGACPACSSSFLASWRCHICAARPDWKHNTRAAGIPLP